MILEQDLPGHKLTAKTVLKKDLSENISLLVQWWKY